MCENTLFVHFGSGNANNSFIYPLETKSTFFIKQDQTIFTTSCVCAIFFFLTVEVLNPS